MLGDSLVLKSLLAGLGLGVVLAGTAVAAPLDRGACLELAPATEFTQVAMPAGERRVALVLANGAYEAVSALPNPPNDGEAVAQRLQMLGFEVHLLIDGTDRAVQDCLAVAAPRFEGADVGLLYYAGHGIQVRDENFAIGINAPSDLDEARGLVSVTTLIEPIRKARVALIFLDACRTNPYGDIGPQGLAVADARIIPVVKPGEISGTDGGQPTGMMISYATSPNAVALDGRGRHSPFTEAFLAAMGAPGHSLQQSLSEIGRLVGEATDFTQTPWSRSSLTELLFLNGTFGEAEAIAEAERRAALAVREMRNSNRALAELLGAYPRGMRAEDFPKFQRVTNFVEYALSTNIASVDLTSAENVSYAPDGTRFVTTTQAYRSNAVVQLWDRQTMQPLAELTQRPDKSRPYVAFSANSSRILVELGPDTAAVFDARSGNLVNTLTDLGRRLGQYGDDGAVNRFSLNGDGTMLLAQESGTRVVDVETGAELFVLSGDAAVNLFGLQPSHFQMIGMVNGQHIVIAAADYDCAVRGLTVPLERPDERQLSAWSPTVRETTESCGAQFQNFSADGRRLAFVYADRARDTYIGQILDVTTGEVVLQRSDPNAGFWHVAPDGQSVYAEMAETGQRRWFPIGADAEPGDGKMILVQNAHLTGSDGQFLTMEYPQQIYWRAVPAGTSLVQFAYDSLPDEFKAAVEADRFVYYPLR